MSTSSDTVPDWVDPAMRAGYGARAAVYTILGGLTVTAAWQGGQTEGTKGALARMRDEPFGQALLWLIALGLICYGIWRLLAAWYDLENRGGDDEGMFARAALVVTGLAHAFFGVSVAGLAMGGSSGGDWTTKLMQLPAGKWIAAAVGLVLLGAGVYYAYKGWKRKYERYIRVTSTTRRFDPLLRFGFIAYGAVLGIVGAFLVIAGLQADPSEAKGIGDALAYVRGMAFGRFLLGLLGLGILGFALENLIEARYRIIPRTAGTDVETLWDRAKHKAAEAT